MSGMGCAGEGDAFFFVLENRDGKPLCGKPSRGARMGMLGYGLGAKTRL